MARLLLCVLLAFPLLLCSAAPVNRNVSDDRCPLTVKILDAVKGVPAGSVKLTVYRKSTDGAWTQVAKGVTDVTGEVQNLISEQDFQSGVYRVEFETKAYWKAEGLSSFHEMAEVTFEAHAGGHRHYILALLLSPFSYTITAVVVNAHE